MARPIIIVGLGNIGQALAKGLLDAGVSAIEAFDVHAERMKEVARSGQVRALPDLKSVTFTNQILILCVKPQDLKKVAVDVAGRLAKTNLVITILAGTMMETVTKHLRHEGPIVRAMPNMPAVVRLAATAMCGNRHVSDVDKGEALKIFQAVGEAYWTQEDLMDTVTGLSGSGPAYVYMVLEALTDGGVKMGLPRELAMKLSAQTVLGAATLVKATGMHPAVLRDQVATPAGTTISALHELEAHGLRNMFVSAVVAATERARVIGKALNSDNP